MQLSGRPAAEHGRLVPAGGSRLSGRVGAHGLDLRAYYAGVSRRFWLLFALNWIGATSITLWIAIDAGHGQMGCLVSPFYLIPPVAVLLAFIGNRIMHTVCLLEFSLL